MRCLKTVLSFLIKKIYPASGSREENNDQNHDNHEGHPGQAICIAQLHFIKHHVGHITIIKKMAGKISGKVMEVKRTKFL